MPLRLRGKYILPIKTNQQDYNAPLRWLQEEEQSYELYASAPSPDTYAKLLELLKVRKQLDLHLPEVTQTSWVRRAESLFEQVDKNGKLLAMLVTD